ncbi:MAG: hypothetical protein SFV23_08475 [Planctomycetaceae bacterium]|nr:hypothetical protein [Planctomycetaceae bacterium]
MLTDTAAYLFRDDGVDGEVLGLPAAITCGASLPEARSLPASALKDMAEFALESGEALLLPAATIHPADADLDEPRHLLFQAVSEVEITPVASESTRPHSSHDQLRLPPGP